MLKSLTPLFIIARLGPMVRRMTKCVLKHQKQVYFQTIRGNPQDFGFGRLQNLHRHSRV